MGKEGNFNQGGEVKIKCSECGLEVPDDEIDQESGRCIDCEIEVREEKKDIDD